MKLLNVPIPSITEATQNASRWLYQSLSRASQAASPAQLSPADIELARSNIKALAFAQGMGVHGAYRYLRDFIARQAVPNKSSGEFLWDWFETYGLSRKEPSAAQGQAAGTGVNGTVLEAGTLLQDSRGKMVRVLADPTVASGTLTVQLIAMQVGEASNMAPGTQLTLVSSVAGIDPTFTTAAGILGGADLETEPQAIYRLVQRLSNEPLGGAPGDYARWALGRPGITRAWGLRNPAGPTTAGVIIMADANLPYGLPTPEQQEDVYRFISSPDRGPPDELFVIIPTAQVIDLSIHLVPDTAANRAETLNALRDLFFRESVPGGEIPHNHLVEVISGVVGEYNHQITSPAITSGGSFVATSFAHLLVLGTITWVP